jgi:thioredoxin 1
MIIKNIQQLKNELKGENSQVLLLFYNNWNGSCVLTQRVLEEIIHQHNYPVRLIMVDVDLLPEIMQSYGIHKIPSILFFRNGKVIYQLSGLHSKTDIENKIEEFIDNQNIFNH